MRPLVDRAVLSLKVFDRNLTKARALIVWIQRYTEVFESRALTVAAAFNWPHYLVKFVIDWYVLNESPRKMMTADFSDIFSLLCLMVPIFTELVITEIHSLSKIVAVSDAHLDAYYLLLQCIEEVFGPGQGLL